MMSAPLRSTSIGPIAIDWPWKDAAANGFLKAYIAK